MGENYEQVILTSGQKDQVSDVLDTYLDDSVGSQTGVAKNTILNNSCKLINSAVDYVQNNLPNGIERVDGSSVCPLLETVANSKLDEV